MLDTRSPEHMHQCLVRHILVMTVKSRQKAAEFLDLWEKKHKDPNSRLRLDSREQWRLGNRGKHGDWRTGPAGE